MKNKLFKTFKKNGHSLFIIALTGMILLPSVPSFGFGHKKLEEPKEKKDKFLISLQMQVYENSSKVDSSMEKLDPRERRAIDNFSPEEITEDYLKLRGSMAKSPDIRPTMERNLRNWSTELKVIFPATVIHPLALAMGMPIVYGLKIRQIKKLSKLFEAALILRGKHKKVLSEKANIEEEKAKATRRIEKTYSKYMPDQCRSIISQDRFIDHLIRLNNIDIEKIGTLLGLREQFMDYIYSHCTPERIERMEKLLTDFEKGQLIILNSNAESDHSCQAQQGNTSYSRI